MAPPHASPITILATAVIIVLLGMLAWLALWAARSGGLPSEKAIRRLTVGALALFVPGIVLLGVATLGPTRGICNDESCGLLSIFLGLALAALGLIPASIALVVSLVAMARAHRWGWFVGLLLPVIAAAVVSLTADFGKFFALGSQFWVVAGAFSLIPLADLIVSVAGQHGRRP